MLTGLALAIPVAIVGGIVLLVLEELERNPRHRARRRARRVKR